MQTRKFLFYTHALAGGGAERVWALIASEFARRGHRVTFAVDFEAPENRRFLAPAVELVALPPGHHRSVLGLAGLMRREKPDVTLSAIGASNLKAMLAAVLVGRPRHLLVSFHGFFASEPQLLSRIGNHLAPLITRLAGRSVAVSEALRRALVAGHGASPARTITIHNPVDFLGAPAKLSESELLARPPQCLFVGRFSPDKDISTLLRAFALVRHPEARLLIVGDGALRPAIEADIARLGLADRVRLAGYLPDPSAAYLGSRVLAISSIRESFGNVVAEALAHGLAVVSTNAAGPAEILAEGRYGAVVPIGDADALASAIEAALAAPGDPAKRMDRARDFSIERATARYLEACEAVIAGA